MPWHLVEGQHNMLANFAVIIGVAFVLGSWENKQLLDVPLSHNNHKRYSQKKMLHSLVMWARLPQ
jgi:hypothetical protein